MLLNVLSLKISYYGCLTNYSNKNIEIWRIRNIESETRLIYIHDIGLDIDTEIWFTDLLIENLRIELHKYLFYEHHFQVLFG